MKITHCKVLCIKWFLAYLCAKSHCTRSSLELEMSGKEEKVVQMPEKKLSEIERENLRFGIEDFIFGCYLVNCGSTK